MNTLSLKAPIISLLAVAALLVPASVFAQIGPCPSSGTCPDGQVCLTPPEGGPQCFKTCTPGVSDPAADEGCPTGNTCGGADTALGRNVCISLEGSSLGDLSDTDTGETPSEPARGTAEERPFQSITPRLGVEVPGVTFSPATKQGDTVYVPFLAQYISGVYRYAVGVVLIISIVMVVYGGFRYLVGSSYEDVSRGKEIIRDAIAGMLIVIGAYMILQTINPATLDLSVLKLELVDQQELILRSTTAETGVDSAGEPGAAPSGPPPDSPYTACPFTLENPVSTSPYRRRDDRTREFMTRISSTVSGEPAEKVILIAQAAVECGLHMGACGSSSETVYEAAGIEGHGRRIDGIGTANTHYLQELTRNCRTTTGDSRECKREARRLAAERFSSNIENWPDAYTDQLRPGDFINVFTVWTSDDAPNGAGQHSAIFLGWESGGQARLFNGSWGNNVRYSSYCIASSCGDRMYPITNIWRPN